MPWFRTDDGFPNHRKVRGIPRGIRVAVIGTWQLCGNWATGELTDGDVPADVVVDQGGKPVYAEELVKAGLWHAHGQMGDCDRCPEPPPGHYQFHDWTDYQPTAEQVLAEREAAAERMRKVRAARRNGPGVGRSRPRSPDGTFVSSEERSQESSPEPGLTPSPVPKGPRDSSSSGHLPERASGRGTDDDGPSIDELLERGIGRLEPAALRAEAEAFRAHNGGRWAGLHDWRRAWSGWLTKAQERRRPTHTPDTPHCPLHPDQPTGSKACPRCAAEGTPPPDLRALREQAST